MQRAALLPSQKGYSLSQKRIPLLKTPEKGLIGSPGLEGLRRLRSGSACLGFLLNDLGCSYCPLPLLNLVESFSNFRLLRILSVLQMPAGAALLRSPRYVHYR